MSFDPETGEQAAGVLKRFCPLKTVLKQDRPCSYFGSSGTCSDCSYKWMVIVDELSVFFKKRRASYEKEREKNKKTEEELKRLKEMIDNVLYLSSAFLNGVKAGKDLLSIFEHEKSLNQEESLNDDAEKRASVDTDGKEGIEG